MKKANTIIAFLLVLVAVVGCKKDTDPAAEAPEVKVIKVTPRQHGATFEWDVVDMPGKFQTCVELSRHVDMSDLLSLPAYETETSFVANIDTLTANTTYYYRIVVWNKFKRFEFGKGGTPFTTLETPTPGQDTTYYTISVSWQPEEGGTATGGGRIAEGDTCTLTATANEGYRFVNWTEGEGNSVADTAAIFSFVVTADRALVANFVEESAVLYTVTAIAEPTEGGTVTGGGTYEEGREIELNAMQNLGYSFDHWQDGNRDNPRTITVTTDTTYTAYFSLNEYTVSVSATTGGTVYVGDMTGVLQVTYTHGDTCMVHAIPATGYEFVNWTESGTEVSRDAHYSFDVTRSWTLVANFAAQAPNTYTITVSSDPSTGGQVAGGGSFQQGQTCTVTATPNTGYDFVNWTANDTVVWTEAAYPFTVQSDRNLVAHFQVKSYTIRVMANGNNGSAYVGEIVGTIQATYTYGQTCWVHASANDGYIFANWTESDTIVSTNANYRFEVKGSRTFVANFTELQPDEFSITVLANPSDGGEVEGAGVYEDGEECMLTAIPADCYKFTSWSDGSTNNPHTVTVTGDAEYTANFERSTDTITVNAGTGGTAHVGSSTGPTSQPVDCGASCTIYAVADEHYEFDNWTEGSTVVSPDPTHTVDNVTENHTFKANFKKQTYHISVSADPTNGGTVSGGGDYEYNESCMVTATPNTNSHYHFVNWTENSTVVSENLSYTFNVTGNHNLVANLELDSYLIRVFADPTNGGTVSINGGGTSGTFTHGTSITLSANANMGYTFDHWQDGNTQNPRYITVTAVADYTAHFQAQSQAPTGAINGKFTINANGDKVYFSKGNLQYIGSAGNGDDNNTGAYWKFADHQWDCLGNNGQGSNSKTVDRDLFGWGTSGWSGSGATYYRPWDTDNTNGNLYGPSGQYNLTGSYAQADWGVYNAIFYGGNQEGQWRTLTGGGNDSNPSEWYYIFFKRSASTVNGVANARYAKAKVANVRGVILFPDSYTHPSGVAQLVGINETGNTGWNGNDYSATDFGLMEQKGAVFLPVSGIRVGTTIDHVNSDGNYWSSSCENSSYAFSVYFDEMFINCQYSYYRDRGRSVRLVCPAR